jgi:anaerobic selenocysteine-containing dehydrogenase
MPSEAPTGPISSRHFRSCPLCEAMCGLELTVTEGRLERVRGDADDPFSRGHICPKATALIDIENDADRLRVPHVREGDTWRAIAWDEAFELAGRRLGAIALRDGNDAIGVYLGNPNVHHLGLIAYLPALLKMLKTRNVFSASTVDQMPTQVICREMYGHQFLIPIPDLDATDYFLMLGANPLASNGSLMTAPDITHRLKSLTQRGHLVVVDPRRTETAQVASRHLFIRPGTDAWFLIALINRLLANGVNRTARYGNALTGFADALAAIRAADPGDVQEWCGITASSIATLAEELAAASAPVVYGRLGVSTQPFGTLSQWLIQVLNILLGQLDATGGAMVNVPVWPITGAGSSAGAAGRWTSRVRKLPEVSGELPAVCLAEEISTPGPGQIRGLLVSAGNPVLSVPGGVQLEVALADIEFMVAIDPYINETTRFAHLILPPTSALHQTDYDLFFNAFAIRRVTRLNLPVGAPPDAERCDWQIVDGLAAAVAHAMGRAWRAMPAPEALIRQGLAAGGGQVTYEQLADAPHGIDLGPLEPSLIARLTAEGRTVQCAPPTMLAELQRLEAADKPAPLVLIGRRHVRSNNSWMHHSHRLVKGPTRHELWMNPADLDARDIPSGARVRITSAVGAIETEVIATEDVARGVASLPHGFGHQRKGVRTAARSVAGASYNDLAPVDRVDVPSGTAAVNGFGIEVKRVAPVESATAAR